MYFDKKISSTMREQKRMDFALDLKSLNNQGQFAGYASVFHLVDNQRDIILPGAFAQTIKERAHAIKFLWQHQQDEPIGIFDAVFEDSRGLYVEGRLLLNVQRAQEAYALLKAGAINGLSIGYSPVRYTIDAHTGVRRISQVELWEISLVTFPANDAANVTAVKRVEGIMDKEELQQWQRAQSSGQLITLSDALDKAIASLHL